MSACSRALIMPVLLAGLLAPTAGAAQDPAPIRLTLDEALGFASESNPQLRQATNSAMLNGTEMRTTWAEQLLPSASLTLFNSSFNGNLQRQALDNFGNPIANPQAEWNYYSRTVHNLGLTWSFQGPSLFQAHRRQQLDNEDRDVGRLRALTDVQFEVQRLYLDALEQRELMRTEEESVEARRIDLDVAERLFSLALKTRVDVLNAELAIEQQTLTLRQQEAAYERALLALKTVIGLTDGRPIDLAEEELPIFDPVGFDGTALVSRAMEVNPALRQAEIATRGAQLGLAEERSAWWPEVSVGLDIYKQAYEQGGQGLFDTSLGTDLESQFRVAFSLPVLNGLFRQRLQQQRASIEVSNQREADRQERLELEESVRGALLELENQWSSFELSERSNAIATEALRLAREEYRLGTRSFEDLRSAFQQEADTRRQIITSRHSFVEALLALEAAVGMPIREMIPQSAAAEGS